MAENKVSDTVNDMVNSMVEDINSAQNGSNKVSAIKDNVGYDNMHWMREHLLGQYVIKGLFPGMMMQILFLRVISLKHLKK